jgi:hypothetical protein
MTITGIMEHIEIWDQNLHMSFAAALCRTVEEITKIRRDSNYTHLVNIIIKFFIMTISNETKNIGEEYIRNFNEVIDIMTEKYRLNIDSEIVEISTTMGSFGKNVVSRRYSVYFCACLIRVK